MKKLTYRFMVATQYEDAEDVIYFFKSREESEELMDTLEFLNIDYTLSEIPITKGKKLPEDTKLS